MPPQKPNILFIVADHHTWHGIANRSPARTPHLNRLAEEGLLFNRSYTPISLCCPARAMLISGCYPWKNGVFTQIHVPTSLHRDMHPEVVTYSQRLREAGYHLGYCGKWHASHVRGPMDLGFHENRDLMGVDEEYRKRHGISEEELYGNYKKAFAAKLSGKQFVSWPGTQEDPFLMWACDEREPEATHTHFIAERASGMVRDFSAKKSPWHVEVHFPEPHDAYCPLRKFLDHYDINDIELPESYYKETFKNKPGLHSREASLWSQLDEKAFKEGVRHFYAYCEQVDHYVGKILQTLQETGQADNTLVVFTSDHGDMMGAHRMFIKGWMPYEESHRTPMIARWPGVIQPGTQSNALVQLHDWAHTFVQVAGASPLPFSDGKDLTPILRDSKTPGPEHILNVYYGAEFLYTQRILIGQRYKYVFNGFDWDEFYDLERDPSELHNAINDPEYAAAIEETREALWKTMEKLDDPYAMPNRYGARRYLTRRPA